VEKARQEKQIKVKIIEEMAKVYEKKKL